VANIQSAHSVTLWRSLGSSWPCKPTRIGAGLETSVELTGPLSDSGFEGAIDSSRLQSRVWDYSKKIRRQGGARERGRIIIRLCGKYMMKMVTMDAYNLPYKWRHIVSGFFSPKTPDNLGEAIRVRSQKAAARGKARTHMAPHFWGMRECRNSQ
jgi:hypothetical protein